LSRSLIASTFGIEAARQHLGHRDIRTTSAHYEDKKRRVEVNLPMSTAAGQLRAVEAATLVYAAHLSAEYGEYGGKTQPRL
jgi:hypothetical protein